MIKGQHIWQVNISWGIMFGNQHLVWTWKVTPLHSKVQALCRSLKNASMWELFSYFIFLYNNQTFSWHTLLHMVKVVFLYSYLPPSIIHSLPLRSSTWLQYNHLQRPGAHIEEEIKQILINSLPFMLCTLSPGGRYF